jgi:hypothetical protein
LNNPETPWIYSLIINAEKEVVEEEAEGISSLKRG